MLKKLFSILALSVALSACGSGTTSESGAQNATDSTDNSTKDTTETMTSTTDKYVEIKTSEGDITVCLYGDTPRHQANFLKLDCSKVKSVFGWKPRWTANQAVEKTVEWTKAYTDGADMAEYTEKQIKEFFNI